MSNAYLHLVDLASIAQIALACIAALALIGAVAQALVTRSATRQTLTYNYTDRFADPALIPFRQKTSDLFALSKATEDEKWEIYRRWSVEDKVEALLLPNLIEELAGMYNNGLLNKKIVEDFFGFTANELWNDGWWFIRRSRDTYAAYYSQWETMLRDMGYQPTLENGRASCR